MPAASAAPDEHMREGGRERGGGGGDIQKLQAWVTALLSCHQPSPAHTPASQTTSQLVPRMRYPTASATAAHDEHKGKGGGGGGEIEELQAVSDSPARSCHLTSPVPMTACRTISQTLRLCQKTTLQREGGGPGAARGGGGGGVSKLHSWIVHVHDSHKPGKGAPSHLGIVYEHIQTADSVEFAGDRLEVLGLKCGLLSR